MTTCDKIQPRLTAYLDGELADDDGSVVRGHLRECEPCRQMARDEAGLRDGLRALAPIDPPQALWSGIQARLAAAEVADARKPRWRRHAERWLRWASEVRFSPTLPQLAAAGVVAVAAIAMVVWRAQRAGETDEVIIIAAADRPGRLPMPARPERTTHDVPTVRSVPTAQAPDVAADVTADLLADPARATASYDRVIEELMEHAAQESARWSADAKAVFDTRVVRLRDAIARAGQGRAARNAQGSMIEYLQRVVARDEVVLASRGVP